MKIKITQEYLINGKKRSPFKCPLALALNNETGLEWSVTPEYCRCGNLVLGENDPLLRDFIYKIDSGVKVEPCELDFPWVDKAFLELKNRS